MKKLINIFSTKPKAIETEKPTLKLSHSIVPEGHGTLEHYNMAWQEVFNGTYHNYMNKKFSKN